MLKAPPWQRLSSALAPPQGAPGGSGQLGTPRKRPAHCGAQLPRRELERATFKVANFTAFDHLGVGLHERQRRGGRPAALTASKRNATILYEE